MPPKSQPRVHTFIHTRPALKERNQARCLKIPTNKPKELIDLAKSVYVKHVADGDASLLKTLNWTEAAQQIDEALQNHLKAEEYKRQMKKDVSATRSAYQPLLETARNSRDILTRNLKIEMKRMGDWGFDISDSLRASAKAPESVSNHS